MMKLFITLAMNSSTTPMVVHTTASKNISSASSPTEPGVRGPVMTMQMAARKAVNEMAIAGLSLSVSSESSDTKAALRAASMLAESSSADVNCDARRACGGFLGTRLTEISPGSVPFDSADPSAAPSAPPAPPGAAAWRRSERFFSRSATRDLRRSIAFLRRATLLGFACSTSATRNRSEYRYLPKTMVHRNSVSSPRLMGRNTSST
mmetsp:Transcript_146252/g.354929  ORF Transcript_146252/g.354929 Transcript_146252/m.354929 type:complete len:207 (+) Transcript_146252:634-1254(+)